MGGSYGQEVIDDMFRHLTEEMSIKDKHILVIGSQRPWVETTVLEAGAKHVTTLEYVPIKSEYEKITTITPEELTKQYINGTLPHFDGMVTFSSVEHSGLGRYFIR